MIKKENIIKLEEIISFWIYYYNHSVPDIIQVRISPIWKLKINTTTVINWSHKQVSVELRRIHIRQYEKEHIPCTKGNTYPSLR